MKFQEKIQLLMQIYRMNNITLAHGTGVDASLISRWRNGERVPSKRSHAPEEIASFLAGAPILPIDLKALEQTIGKDNLSQEEMASAIAAWLRSERLIQIASPAPKPLPAIREEHTAYTHAADTVKEMAQILRPNIPEQTGPVNVYPFVQHGTPGEHEDFLGESGKRKAVLSFFHKLQQVGQQRKLDIFILTSASQDWITRDEQFVGLWKRCLLSMVQKGHRIHIAIPTGELRNSVPFWLQTDLFYSSQVRIYAIPTRLVDTLLVVSGQSAVLSYGIGVKEEVTMLFSTVLDTSTFGAVFMQWVSQGFPALYTCETAVVFSERLATLESEGGDSYSAQDTPSTMFLFNDDVQDILEERHVVDRHLRLQTHVKRRENLGLKLKQYQWVSTISRRALSTLGDTGTIVVEGLELGLDEPLELSGKTVIHLLKTMLQLLDAHANFHLVVTDSQPLPVQIWYKAGVGAQFTMDRRFRKPGAPVSVFSGQPESNLDLEKWFSSLTYTREDTKTLLTSLLEKLSAERENRKEFSIV